MDLNCFYCNYGTDESVSAPDFIVVNELAASKFARLVLTSKDDFFGLVNEDGDTIQFLVEGYDLITIDMPVKAEEGEEYLSYQRKSDMDEVEEVIVNLPKSFVGLEAKLKLKKPRPIKAKSK